MLSAHVLIILLFSLGLARAQTPRGDLAPEYRRAKTTASPTADWPSTWPVALKTAALKLRKPVAGREAVDDSILAMVYYRGPQERRLAEATLPKKIATYKHGDLYRLTPSALRRMEGKGLRIKAFPKATRIGHCLFPFDTRSERISFPPALADKSKRPKDRRIHWLQFIGPPKDEWLAEVKSGGVRLLAPYPHFAYLVWADDGQIESATKLPYIRWSGIYEPGFKLSPELAAQFLVPDVRLAFPTKTVQLIVCVLLADGANKSVFADLERSGARVDMREVADFYEWARVTIAPEKIADLVRRPSVLSVEIYYPPMPEDEVSDQISAGNYSSGGVPYTGYQGWLADIKLDGTGVTVGIVDDGIDDSHPDLAGRVVSLDYGGGTEPEGHGHHVAGIVAGSGSIGTTDGNGFLYGLGVAPAANLIDQAVLTSGSSASYRKVVRDCVSTAGPNGVKGYIQNNSWGSGSGNPPGTNTTYESVERAYDLYVRDADDLAPGNQQLIICFSAGNEGENNGCPAPPQTLTRPKAAKNIIVTGATNNYRPARGLYANSIEHLAVFSSRGPAADGRIKPDVCQPGAWIASLRAGSDSLWGDIDSNYRWCGGTSQACPHTAGCAALLTQWWQGAHGGQRPSPALVKALLINSAVDMNALGDTIGGCSSWESTTPTIPNEAEGWGRVNLRAILQAPVPIEMTDQTEVFQSPGETYTVSGYVADPSRPVRVTLVWTDAAGAIGADPALVNDLDLTVSVNGTVYRGNNFSGGFTVAGGTADSINNVENVFLPTGTSGPLEVEVAAATLEGNGVPGNTDSTDQDFALVLYNFTSAPPKRIATSPSAFSIQQPEGDNVTSRILSIWNGASSATMDYSVAATPTWLSCSPSSGSATDEPTTHIVFVDSSGLNTGDYAGTVTIAAPDAENNPLAVPVSLEVTDVPPTAEITSISPNPAQPPGDAVEFQGEAEDAAGAIATYEWTSDRDGRIGEEAEFSTSSNALEVGLHTITFIAWDDEGSSSSASTTLTILNAVPSAEIVALSPDPVTAGATVTLTLAGQDNDESGREVTDGELKVGSVVYNNVLPGGHYFAAPATQGEYIVAYRVMDDEGTWSAPSTRALEVVQPRIGAAPTSFTLEAEADGDPSTATLSVWNDTGLDGMDYTIATTPTWLSCFPPTGTAAGEPTTHTVAADPTGLAVGDYAGTITITSSNATNSPLVLSVRFNVKPRAPSEVVKWKLYK